MKQTPEHTANHAAAMRGRKASDEVRQIMSVASKGMLWITNGVENSKIRDLSLMPDGWSRGRVFRDDLDRKSGWVFITDGVTTKGISPNVDLPDGWIYGRMKKGCTEPIEHNAPDATN